MKVILSLTIFSFIIFLLFLNIVYAGNQVHTAASIDGSPFGFTVINPPIINSSTLTINSNLNNTFSSSFNNGWNHNFATYVYGGTGSGSSSTFTNNSTISNYANINNQNLLGFNFINVVSWVGYNWANYSQNSFLQNNGIINNNIDITNQPTGNFYNYSLYSVNVDFSNIQNIGNITNNINVQNSNIDNLYNFSLTSYDTKIADNFQNSGNIQNTINLQNTQLSGGLYNYVFNSFSFSNSIDVNFSNDGNVFNIVNSANSSASSFRNQALLVYNPIITNNVINIQNSGLIQTDVLLSGSNYDFLSNDGIAVFRCNVANVSNNGIINVFNSWDSSFSGTVDSTSGIYFANVNSGSILNTGMIRVKGSTVNNFSAAGINLFQSGWTNPIQIQTPVLMDLDNNVRHIIVNNSNAELLNFAYFINGDPNTMLRPILVYNASNLNLNNTILHLYVGQDIHLNKPYYLIENQGSNVSGQFDLNFVSHFVLNPNIKVSWFDNVGDNSSIIFTINSASGSSIANSSRIQDFIIGTNISEHIRNQVVLNLSSDSEESKFSKNVKLRNFNVFEKFESNQFNFDGKLWGTNFVADKYLKENMKLGVIISTGKVESSNQNYFRSQIPFERKTNYLGYGLYFLFDQAKFYVLANFNNYNLSNKINSYTGVDLSVQETLKFNSNTKNFRLEFSWKTRNKENIVLGFENNILSKLNYVTNTQNLLWQKNIKVDQQSIDQFYLGIDKIDFTNTDIFFLTVRGYFLLNNKEIQVIENLQGSDYIFQNNLSEFTLRFGAFYQDKQNRKVRLGLTAEFNKYYSKFAIQFPIRM